MSKVRDIFILNHYYFLPISKCFILHVNFKKQPYCGSTNILFLFQKTANAKMALGSDNHAYSGQGGQTDGQGNEDVNRQMAREHGSPKVQDGQTNGQVKEQVKGQITKDQEAVEDKVDHLSILSISNYSNSSLKKL